MEKKPKVLKQGRDDQSQNVCIQGQDGKHRRYNKGQVSTNHLYVPIYIHLRYK